MTRIKTLVTSLLMLSLLPLTGGIEAAFAQVTFVPPPTTSPNTIVRPKIPTPTFSVQITIPTKKKKQTAPASTKPKPVANRAPVILDNIPLPKPRPLLSLGRPALLDAARMPNMIAVLVVKDPDTDPANTLAEDFDLSLVSRMHLAMFDADLVMLRADKSQIVDKLVALLSRDARVLGVQPDYLFELQQGSDNNTAKPSSLYELQYAPQKMAVASAHQISMGENTTIAVIDTGVDLTHAELNQSAFQSFDAIGLPVSNAEKHGTAIAGLIAANTHMLGIAPSADFLAVRAFAQTENGKFTSDTFIIAKAIDWAVAQNAQVLNMSFAGPSDPLIMKMMDMLAETEIFVVAAAGNHGIGAPAAYPAAHPHTFAVTATDARDALYSNANRGIYIDIAAPGVDVIAPAPNNRYELVTGTSIATAHLTGIIALMLSKNPDLTRDQILTLLQQTSLDAGTPGQDPKFGLGLVNAFKITNQL